VKSDSPAQEQEVFDKTRCAFTSPWRQIDVWMPSLPGVKVFLDLFNTTKTEIPGKVHISLRNSEGIHKNETILDVSSQSVISFDLSLVAGNSHDVVGREDFIAFVRFPSTYTASFRYVSADRSSSIITPVQIISRTAPFFSLLTSVSNSESDVVEGTFSPGVGFFHFGLLNLSDERAEVQCRLYYEKFFRELTKLIPARGVASFSIEEDFKDVLLQEHDSKPSFVRISQRLDRCKVGVQVVEQVASKNEKFFYKSAL
jgi:hypothetical protein